MASAYPGGLDNFATNKTNATTTPTDHPGHHNDLADAVNKIEAELGIAPSGALATVVARLNYSAARISDPSGADQALAAVTPTLVTFDTEDYDTDGYANLGVNADRVTISVDGLYLIGGTVGFIAAAGLWYNVHIYKNGLAGTDLASSRSETSAAAQGILSVSVASTAVAGDYFSIAGTTEGGADIPHTAIYPNLWIARLGI